MTAFRGSVAVLTATLVVAASAASAAVDGPSLRHFDRRGIAFEYPRAWFVTTEPLSNATDPKYLVTVSSHSVRRTPRDEGPCLPGVARQLPDDGVLAYLREAFYDRAISIARMHGRPRSFRLPNRSDNALCGFPSGRWVPFKAGGRAFYLGIYVGRSASPASVRALQRLIDGMRIAPR
jgi:hypothetical protein